MIINSLIISKTLVVFYSSISQNKLPNTHIRIKRTQAMTELKDKLKKLEKDIKALITNQKRWKEETKK